MPVHGPHHRVVRTIPVLWIAVLAAICCAAASAAVSSSQAPALKGRRPALAGTWSGSYHGAFAGTFTLHWTRSGSHLSGSITLSNPRGRYGISGNVRGSTLTFGAVGAGATYTGKVSGKSMSGTFKTPRGGGSWSAHKTS
jgi:hypothetical protein